MICPHCGKDTNTPIGKTFMVAGQQWPIALYPYYEEGLEAYLNNSDCPDGYTSTQQYLFSLGINDAERGKRFLMA